VFYLRVVYSVTDLFIGLKYRVSMPRKTTSKYARAKTPADSSVGEAEPVTAVRPSTLDTLTSQIEGLTKTLQQTQQEVSEAKKSTDSVLGSNTVLRKELDVVTVAAVEASSANSLLKLQLDAQKQKKAWIFSFQHKGNEQQYEAIDAARDTLIEAKAVHAAKLCEDVDTMLDDAIEALRIRLKHVRMADQHPGGWALVKEYLGSGIGDYEADERKIKSAEAALENKFKRKYEGNGRGNYRGKRGGRGGGRGQGNYGGQYHDSQTAPVIQLVAPSGWTNGSANSGQGTSTHGGNGYVHRSKPGQPRTPGPCYHCQGPHLVAHCPELAAQAAEVQAKIEGAYYRKS
jgi:hypothetical protein